MNLIKTITPTQAAKWMKIDRRTFNELAKRLGFTKYPGTTPRKIRYNKEDIALKYNKPLDEFERPKKKSRGKIKI